MLDDIYNGGGKDGGKPWIDSEHPYDYLATQEIYPDEIHREDDMSNVKETASVPELSGRILATGECWVQVADFKAVGAHPQDGTDKSPVLYLLEVPVEQVSHIPYATLTPSKRKGYVIVGAVNRDFAKFPTNHVDAMQELEKKGRLRKFTNLCRLGQNLIQLFPCAIPNTDSINDGRTWFKSLLPHPYLRGCIGLRDYTLDAISSEVPRKHYYIMDGYDSSDTRLNVCRVCRSPFACWANKCDLPHRVGKLPSKRSTYPSAMQRVWTLKDKYPIRTSRRPSEWVVADQFFTNLNDPG
jgi:hypothetical protein